MARLRTPRRVDGRAVQRLRLAHGLAETELARRAGVSEKTIRLVESGAHSPRIKTADAIAAALGVRLEALLT